MNNDSLSGNDFVNDDSDDNNVQVEQDISPAMIDDVEASNDEDSQNDQEQIGSSPVSDDVGDIVTAEEQIPPVKEDFDKDISDIDTEAITSAKLESQEQIQVVSTETVDNECTSEDDGRSDAQNEPNHSKLAEEDSNLNTGDNETSDVDNGSDEQIVLVESPYAKSNYLHFGFETVPGFIDVNDTLSYLQACGFDDNSLTQARERAKESLVYDGSYDPHKENCRYCDFCGEILSGVEYEIISDGRERCNECSRTVLKTLDEFNDAFLEVRSNMENMFSIKIFASIDVKTMDAKKLAKKLKIKFTPTAGFDGRVLGVAIDEHGTYRLYVENQSPYLNAVATIAHELTHIWQYLNWSKKHIIKRYGRSMELCIYEGMAKWVEIQYLYFINEPDRAYRELCATLARDDEYGNGLRLFLDEYDLSTGVNVDIKTPFFDVNEPLHDI